MSTIVSIRNLSKVYGEDVFALKNVSLEIEEGEILALLGPNGAGKTTLISIICGIVTPSDGQVLVDGHDVVREYRRSRKLIGLVPQEVALEPFGQVRNSLRFSRGLFGKPPNDAYIEDILKRLSLWDKREAQIVELSGGMKRRVLIAKSLAHEPRILFLDEPTAGVDVELRQDMWQIVRKLRDDGVTIILTTHYIEEAEAIADRVGVINRGELLLIEDKAELMRRMGRKQMRIELQSPVDMVPESLVGHDLERVDDGAALLYTYDSQGDRTGITGLLNDIHAAGLVLRDLQTSQSSLEEIFVDLVGRRR
ncbi:MAG: ABC transporter ATP-binding protein [Pseudomonadota bacterium]